jgi:putative ABC transport system permease protein
LRTSADPSSLIPAARAAVRELDPAIPLHRIRPLHEIASSSVAHQRFQMLLVTAFSALMLVLAVVGTYGVTAYGVSERTNELGVRAALGASQSDIRKLVMAEGARMAIVGILIGAAVVGTLSPLLGRLAHDINGLDPITLASVPAILLVSMLVAAFIPARRASRVSPMQALRSE